MSAKFGVNMTKNTVVIHTRGHTTKTYMLKLSKYCSINDGGKNCLTILLVMLET